jgi:CRISPR-associated protein Csh1
MLDTLLKIGRQLGASADRGEFDFIISPPFIKEQDRVKFKFYVAEIVFDLDDCEVGLGKPRDFSEIDKDYEFSPYSLRCIATPKRRNKGINLTVPPNSYEVLKKTLFGKHDPTSPPKNSGELSEVILSECKELSGGLLHRILKKIFELKDQFNDRFPNIETISNHLDLGEKNRIAMLFVSVKGEKELGIDTPTPIVRLDGYDFLLKKKFRQLEGLTNEGKGEPPILKLCYASGEFLPDVEQPDFQTEQDGLNKMFVKTTKNYAQGFDGEMYYRNYQVSNAIQNNLADGSKYLLNKFKAFKIAGVDHCIIPEIREGKELDLDYFLTKLKHRAELLFQMDKLKELENDLEAIAADDIYWITFLGFEQVSGKSFKTVSLIRDISKTHFSKIISNIRNVNNEMAEILGDEWYKVMTWNKDEPPCSFNFHTIYWLIPVHVDKLKKVKASRNDALIVFKAILEKRGIEYARIFNFFSELIQIHRLDRSNYNIAPNNNFDFAVRNAVFQYQAFIQFLRKTNLLIMEEMTTPASAATLPEAEPTIVNYFDRMHYKDPQKAMFYLGRVLNNVAYAQFKKGHPSKPILNKLNYNGMDKRAIIRLRIDLMEKCKQYDVLNFNELNFSKFGDLFNPESFKLSPEEALFFLLSGYSFRTYNEVKEDSNIVEPHDAE